MLLSKLYLFVLIFLIGCVNKKTVDPYGLEDRLRQSQNYQQSLEEMEESYKEEVGRLQGRSESDQTKKKFGFATLRSLLPFKDKGPEE